MITFLEDQMNSPGAFSMISAASISILAFPQFSNSFRRHRMPVSLAVTYSA